MTTDSFNGQPLAPGQIDRPTLKPGQIIWAVERPWATGDGYLSTPDGSLMRWRIERNRSTGNTYGVPDKGYNDSIDRHLIFATEAAALDWLIEHKEKQIRELNRKIDVLVAQIHELIERKGNATDA